ncbi:MAG: response regulator [Amaricoccus sp.]|uniref:response regulator n=1 Tax=Amaricoccus sp. TaxID=1872485 RepID=UPI0039E57851
MAERETVLVVEDEALILFTIADELRQAGYRVVEAQDADQAVRLLETDSRIRLVFTDIDMPGSMDGLRLAALVRDRWPPVHIIVTSGKRVPDAALLPCGSRFLAKPYTSTSVLDAAHGLLH